MSDSQPQRLCVANLLLIEVVHRVGGFVSRKGGIFFLVVSKSKASKKAAHCWQVWNNRQNLGACMLQNVQTNQLLLTDLHHGVIVDDSVFDPNKDECFNVSMHGLETIAKDCPTATILGVKREPKKWFDSAVRQGNVLGQMMCL